MVSGLSRACLTRVRTRLPRAATLAGDLIDGSLRLSDKYQDAETRSRLDASALLVRSLSQPGVFEHAVDDYRVIATHISWIVLTGDYAYKIKKPVAFDFLDFSTLELRRRYCEEELRLNQRYAPGIYLDVVAIRGSADTPRLHGEGPAIEYAVRMKQFAQASLLSAHASASTLARKTIDAMAQRVADLHAVAARALPGDRFGHAANVQRLSQDNLDALATSVPVVSTSVALRRLCDWYRGYPDLVQRLEQRLHDGYVRDCHGDLHLGNMALIDGEVMPFDCIEFNPELRWIDVISESAFVAMDLEERGYSGYAWRFISRYLEQADDYDGIDLLRYYVVYRALVRAKVEVLRVSESGHSAPGAYTSALDYIDLADRWAGRRQPGLVLMHGLSGSGKSTVAERLTESLGAIQLRSDVVRKRLHGLAAASDSHSTPGGNIYTADASAATYRRLAELAACVVAAGFRVIVDATFLQRGQRETLLQLTAGGALPCVAVHCSAPTETLRARILARDNDPSEANLQVLEWQLERQQAPSLEENGLRAIVNVGEPGLDSAHIDRIERLLAG